MSSGRPVLTIGPGVKLVWVLASTAKARVEKPFCIAPDCTCTALTRCSSARYPVEFTLARLFVTAACRLRVWLAPVIAV